MDLRKRMCIIQCGKKYPTLKDKIDFHDSIQQNVSLSLANYSTLVNKQLCRICTSLSFIHFFHASDVI